VDVPPWDVFVLAEFRPAVRAEFRAGLDGQAASRARRFGGLGLGRRVGVDLADGSVLFLAKRGNLQRGNVGQ